MRMLVAHPPLTLQIDEAALAAFQHLGPDAAHSLGQLVGVGQALGEHGSFAALAQQLKELGSEYDEIIGEIAAGSESDYDSERSWLVSTIREIKLNALKAELQQLFASGLPSEKIGVRYREITQEQGELERERDAELVNR